MIYGYLRVSSDEQDVNSQKQGVDAFAAQREWKIDEYISDEGVSGGKDPDKRNLGPLLKKLHKDDIVIAAEISRLGRDLFMVMDILHFCMKVGCKIYTVKDNYALGDDIQSKVLAFAFGLAAEIERQMIRQRTKEGLRLRMKMGVLCGRPLGRANDNYEVDKYKDEIIKAIEWGATIRTIAKKINIDRATISRALMRWKAKCDEKGYQQWLAKERERRKQQRAQLSYKEGKYCIVDLPRDKVIQMILADKTIPQIAEELTQYTYEQIYDTILCDEEFNTAYRQHAQKLLVKKK